MHDLIGAYQRLDDMYRLYIKSAFPLRSLVMGNERDVLLKQKGVLSQPPLIEVAPVYPTSGLTLADATAQLTKQLSKDFVGLEQLAQELFPDNRVLYRHQWQSLHEVVVNHRDIVVTTGTGSGKTECFLLPLLAQLARELTIWKAPDATAPDRQWWNPTANPHGNRVSITTRVYSRWFRRASRRLRCD